MKITKMLQNCEVELLLVEINQGCRVSIKASKPFLLFYKYKEFLDLKAGLENVCDEWVAELEKSIHTHITLGVTSFTPEKISLTREYSY